MVKKDLKQGQRHKSYVVDDGSAINDAEIQNLVHSD